MSQPLPKLPEFLDRLRRCGPTDEAYLAVHFARMRRTVSLLRECEEPGRGAQLLDLGAHWLHLAAMFAQEGYTVTAADLAETLDHPGVRAVANEFDIELRAIDDLSRPACLSELEDNTFDVIVFAEVLEHLAFNPRQLWLELRRVLKQDGRLVVTTPNYYSLTTRMHAAARFVTLQGGGLPVWKVLAHPTFAHHWKEYSARELRQYVKGLGCGFEVERLIHVGRAGRNPRPGSFKEWLLWPVWQCVPGLRRDIHLELRLR